MNGLKPRVGWTVICILLGSCFSLAQLEPLYFDRGMVGLGLALRTLPVTTSVLYITAHPDDENDGVLIWLRKGLGMRTGLLTLTRGEGGQNEIGPELFEALGVLRSEELLAVQRYCGARQFFSRAFEFGYSFSVKETFEKWDKRATLGDIVQVIRRFRPTIILTLSPTGEGGGQHHQASARLAAEAFHLAADPDQFPEQIQSGLRPWQPKKLYRAVGRRRQEKETETVKGVRVSLGEMDRLLGESYAQLGARARNNHRCQGMNALPTAGERTAAYVLADAAPGFGSRSGDEETSLFDGLDTSLMDLMGIVSSEELRVPFLRAGLLALQTTIDFSRQSFQGGHFNQVADAVLRGLRSLRELRQGVAASTLSAQAKYDLLHSLDKKIDDFTAAANAANFVELQAFEIRKPDQKRRRAPQGPVAGIDGEVTRNETFFAKLSFFNHGSRSLELERIGIESPSGWKVKRISGSGTVVQPRKSAQMVYRITVAPVAEYNQPYWFRKSTRDYRYQLTRPDLAGEPFTPPLLAARAAYRVNGKSIPVSASLETPVQYRWYDVQTARERRLAIQVVPSLSISLSPDLLLAPVGKAAAERTLRVTLLNNSPGESSATASLQLPPGWSVSPAHARVKFSRGNETASIRFLVRIPPNLKAGDYRIRARAYQGEELFDSGYQVIAYHHIQTRHLFRPAETRVRAFEVDMAPDLRVGYVMGVGDEVPAALEQLGAHVTMLLEEDLATGDLGRFDVIITGIRAYKDRVDLIANNSRLLEYVKQGGYLLVQYNKYEFNRAQYGPYPFSINRPHDRVTDENSKVTILEPDHPIFNDPNHITPADWKHWVQERGLYFMGKWDSRYVPLLELQDPFQYNDKPKRGALLVARYGKGIYVYTGIGFFRQLPAGVPGAYRLFANIISLKKAPERH